MSQQPNWEVRGTAPPSSFYDQYPQEIVELLYRRGFEDQQSIDDWLNPSLKNLRAPQSLKGMAEMVKRLIQALQSGEKICVFADFDMDGTPGLALALKAFQDLGFKDVIYHQPDRFKEGYGLHPHHIDELNEKGVKLIITVDLGITALEACLRASELGIDVLISDHHLAQDELPKAVSIVNPNQPDCESGLGHLCGAGVIFYVFLALKAEMMGRQLLDQNVDSKDWLDCFTIGTVTDMVPLVEENRILVKHGLIALKKTKRLGLQKLMAAVGLKGQDLSAQDVAIKMAPKLNALSRMGSEVRAIELFLVDDPDRANLLVDLVLSVNEQRRNVQSETEAWALKEANSFEGKSFVFIHRQGIHPGILGLIATKVCQKTNKPTFVATENEPGQYLGSARAPDKWEGNLVEVLQFCEDSLEKFGGHSCAAGFELFESNLDSFANLLSNFSFSTYSAKRPSIVYDFELPLQRLDVQLMNWLGAMGPYGQNFEVPKMKLVGLKVLQKKTLRGGHLKMSLRHGARTIDALYFSPDPEHPTLSNLSEGELVDVVAEAQWNFFAGRKTLQLLITDIRSCHGADI